MVNLQSFAATEAVTTISGRGVYYFDGHIKCPFAGVGTRGDYASNRLALEVDDSVVEIDRDRRLITVTHRGSTRQKECIADLMFLCDGTTVDGRTVPFALHLEVFKNGDSLSLDFHRHLRDQDKLVDADFERFDVVVTDGVRRETVMTPASAMKLVTKPRLMHLVIKSMMAMRNHLDGVVQNVTEPGYRLADLSMGFGRGRLTWWMTRAVLQSLSANNAELIRGGSLSEMLKSGEWRLEIEAFTDKMMPQVVKRDLFLFGLDKAELLADVRERGLAKGQRLSFEFLGGGGAVGLDAEREELPSAIDVARAYLEFHMLGGLLAHETEQRIASET